MGIMDYTAPQAKVVEVDVHRILCDSTTPDGAVTMEKYTEETFEW